jgi:hypothetical protein
VRDVTTAPRVGDSIDVSDGSMIVRGVIAAVPGRDVDAVVYVTLPLEKLRRWRAGLALAIPLALRGLDVGAAAALCLS